MISEVSILIPVFNYDVRPLVKELHRQCQQLELTFEILLFDDGSAENVKSQNRTLSNIPSVRYRELPENIGRSAIRNLLATEARYAYLLMLDNDCLPSDQHFMEAYVAAAEGQDIVVGGISYAATAPPPPFSLHYTYGKRAAKPASIRQDNPYGDVYLSNAIVKRDLFLELRLCESLKSYGHEDTIFALRLKQQQIRVRHIENTALHLGLEPTPVFLDKTEQAVENLVRLYRRGEQVEQLRLVQAYKKLQALHLDKAFSRLFPRFRRLFKLNFESSTPSLFLFDLYRLQLFCSKMQQ
ncbi:glycosyltransferase family 2 protein [Pontibacter beigongshangensis]|uniref:glycosyltransferase family 2 protein n=1 Tax=Pontibacter beigongshangensis TaxID=2574733 RepID=UPI00165093BD|nr:glycosyltransferase [Pontibacter beigongshangensis]